MPQDDFVSKSLASAKNALAGAKNFTRSTGDTDPSKLVSKPASPAPAAKPASTGIAREAEDAGKGIAFRAQQSTALGSMKKGGKIPKTGLYNMHKGEDVVKADKSNIQDVLDRAKDSLGGAAANIRAKHGMRTTMIDHYGDGSHSVRHSAYEGEGPSYAVKNTKELASRIKDVLGDKDEPDADDKPGV